MNISGKRLGKNDWGFYLSRRQVGSSGVRIQDFTEPFNCRNVQVHNDRPGSWSDLTLLAYI